MKLMTRFYFIFVAFLCGFFLSTKQADAAISGACTYEVTISGEGGRTESSSAQAPKLAQGEGQASVKIGITPEQAALGICQNNESSQCIMIRYCDESAWTTGAWCHNNFNYPEQQQQIVNQNGNYYIQATSQGSPLMYSRRWWLEVKDNNDNIPWYGYGRSTGPGEEYNACPGDYRNGKGPRVEIAKGICQAGWATITPKGANPNKIVPGEYATLTFNNSRISGFAPFAVFWAGWSKVDGSEFVKGPMLVGAVGSAGHLNAAGYGSQFQIGAFSSPGQYRFMVVDGNFLGQEVYCEQIFNVCDINDESCTLTQTTGKGTLTNEVDAIEKFALCAHISDEKEKTACQTCVGTDTSKVAGIYSAIGCVKVDQKSMLRQLIQILLGVSGLIALLSILAGAFLYTTSQGDTNKIKQAKELITAAVMGLFFIIFSTIILDFITVQVLRIPGLT